MNLGADSGAESMHEFNSFRELFNLLKPDLRLKSCL